MRGPLGRRNMGTTRRVVQGGAPFQGLREGPAGSFSSLPPSPEVGAGASTGSGDWVTLATELTKAGVMVTSASIDAARKRKGTEKKRKKKATHPPAAPGEESSTLPGWLLPVGLGGAALVVVVVLLRRRRGSPPQQVQNAA